MCVHAVGPPTSAQGPAKFFSSYSCARGRETRIAERHGKASSTQYDRTQPNICQTRRTRRNSARTGRRRHRACFCHSGTDPAARAGGQRPHRAGPHRHGQDLRIRCALASGDHQRHRATADGHPARARRGAHPRTVPAGVRRPRRRREVPHRGRAQALRGVHLRRARLRAADRRAAGRRRRRGRHARPAARPRPAGPPAAGQHRRPGARRGRRDARPRLPARHRAHPAPDPREAAVDAVLGDDAGPDHHAGPQLHEPADAHPRRGAALLGRAHHHRPVRIPRTRAGQGRVGQPVAAGPRPRRDDDLHPHQAHRAEGRPTSSASAASRSAPCTAT